MFKWFRFLMAFMVLNFSGMAFASDCYFDVSLKRDKQFTDYRGANQWCQNMGTIFDDFNVCSFQIRNGDYDYPGGYNEYPGGSGDYQSDDYKYDGHLNFSRRFSGNTFSGIMNDYRTWVHSTMWRGHDFKFVIQFFGNCLNDDYRPGGY